MSENDARRTLRRTVLWLLAALFAAIPAIRAAAEGEILAPASEAGSASEAELEVLRRLLGVPDAKPAKQPAVAEQPQPEAGPQPSPATVVETSPAPARPATPTKARPAAAKARPAPAKAKPAPKPAPKPRSAPKPSQPEPAMDEASTPDAVPAAEPAAPPFDAPVAASAAARPAGEAAVESVAADVPPAGTIVDSSNAERWNHLLGPSIAWSIQRGASLEVVDPLPLKMERIRDEATQRYHAQVELAPDKRSMRNYVAGIPFPIVADDDPDAAPKLMFNMENRINVDDLDVRNFSCDTGRLDARRGFELERHYAIEHFRRFYYGGRLWTDPKPTYPNPEGIRYLEMLYPLQEPFDFKGAGFTYIRYLDPNRQDDSWLYFPQLKRVRRIGTAQRSEGVFGQDVDLDSYGGFAGNPAWTRWTLLGRKKILASVHARGMPSPFQQAPADFFPDDVWEARDVYVILGISQLGGYNFGRRIIYLDREGWIIPYTEIYDLKGNLWRTLVHTWKSDDRPRPTAKRSVYEDDMVYITAFTLVDMQLEHATRCQFPAPDMPESEEGWYYHFGAAEGVTPEVFSVQNFVGSGR